MAKSSLLSVTEYAKYRGVSVRSIQKAIQAGRIQKTADGKIDRVKADGAWARHTMVKMGQRGRQSPQIASYLRSRARREDYQARLAKIDYEERTGKLVSGEEVQAAAFSKYRQFRDAMLTIPDRVAAIVAAETSEIKTHAILTAEIRTVLICFADSLNG